MEDEIEYQTMGIDGFSDEELEAMNEDLRDELRNDFLTSYEV